MTDYVSIEDAARLEGISYSAMRSRIRRNPERYSIVYDYSPAGGKQRVFSDVISLSEKARQQYKVQQGKPVQERHIEKLIGNNTPPWYVDYDCGMYMEWYKQRYDEAVALLRDIEAIAKMGRTERRQAVWALAAERGCTERTIYRHVEAYKQACVWRAKVEKETNENRGYYLVLALCDKPRSRNVTPSLTEEQRKVLTALVFDKKLCPNNPSVALLYDMFLDVAQARGWESTPSTQTVRRFIHDLRTNPSTSDAYYLAMEGERNFKNQRMMKGKRDTKGLQRMEVVQTDVHDLDFWIEHVGANGVKVKKRPKLVAFMDVRTRCIVGYLLAIEVNAYVIKEAVAKMVYSTPGGVPKYLYMDNGKEFTANTNTGQNRKERVMRKVSLDSELEGFYRTIGIEAWTRALPHHPWSKGNIERSFRTLRERYSKRFASYVGSLTGSKTGDKREKDIDGMLARGELPTITEAYKVLEEEVAKYHNRHHRGLKDNGEETTIPIMLWEEAEAYDAPIPVPELVVKAKMEGKDAYVTNQGITRNKTLYTHVDLHSYVGQHVNIRYDITDLTRLYVYNKHGEFVCEAVSYELLTMGDRISKQQLEEHMRGQRRQVNDAKQMLRNLQAYGEGLVPSPVIEGAHRLDSKPTDTSKIHALPLDKEHRSEVMQRKAKPQENSYLKKVAMDAIARIEALEEFGG